MLKRQALVIKNFNGSGDEVTIKTGEKVFLIGGEHEGDWCMVQNKDKTGFAPKNCLNLEFNDNEEGGSFDKIPTTQPLNDVRRNRPKNLGRRPPSDRKSADCEVLLDLDVDDSVENTQSNDDVPKKIPPFLLELQKKQLKKQGEADKSDLIKNNEEQTKNISAVETAILGEQNNFRKNQFMNNRKSATSFESTKTSEEQNGALKSRIFGTKSFDVTDETKKALDNTKNSEVFKLKTAESTQFYGIKKISTECDLQRKTSIDKILEGEIKKIEPRKMSVGSYGELIAAHRKNYNVTQKNLSETQKIPEIIPEIKKEEVKRTKSAEELERFDETKRTGITKNFQKTLTETKITKAKQEDSGDKLNKNFDDKNKPDGNNNQVTDVVLQNLMKKIEKMEKDLLELKFELYKYTQNKKN